MTTRVEQCFMCGAKTTEVIDDQRFLKGIDWSRDSRGRPRCPEHPEGAHGFGTMQAAFEKAQRAKQGGT